jgi:hypothetical protein
VSNRKKISSKVEDQGVGEMDMGEEKILYSWKSVERPHKRWGKEFYSTVIVLAVLVSIVFFFIEGVMPVLVIWAVVFMGWAMSKTEPGMVGHEITSRGIRTGGKLYRWEIMRVYWFEDKWDKKLLKVLLSKFPGQLVLVYGKSEEKKVREAMGGFLPLEKPEDTWADRAVKWFTKKVPLE